MKDRRLWLRLIQLSTPPALPWVAASLTLLLPTHGAAGCQVPVFRYALEQWQPSEYRIRIPAKPDNLTPPQQIALQRLKAFIADSELPLNAVLEAKPEWDGALHVSLPGARNPELSQTGFTWKLGESDVETLVDSPTRERLRERLLAGDSAVWLLLKCGNPEKDALAEKTLIEAIEEAQKRLKIPEGATASTPGETSPSLDLLERLPLRIGFSVLPLERSDSREAALIQLLLNVEPHLEGYKDEPMAFAAFGRGRVLEPLIGAGIRIENVLEQGGYLCGACSCEIKDQNPGLDLLLRAQWRPVDTTPKVEIVRIDPASGTTAVSSPPGQAASRWRFAAPIGLALLLLYVFLKPSPKN